MASPIQDTALPTPDADGKVTVFDTVANERRRVWPVDAREMLAAGTACIAADPPAAADEPSAEAGADKSGPAKGKKAERPGPAKE